MNTTKERARISALAQAAILNAIALALISIQFVAPPAFVVLLGLVPAIFALQALLTPPSVALLAGGLAIAIAAALFGAAVGAWAGVYVAAGLVAGFARRLGLPAPLRVFAVALGVVALVAGVILVFLWSAGIDLGAVWGQVVAPSHAGLPVGTPGAIARLGAAAALGLLVLAAVAAASVDAFVGAILPRIAADGA